MRYPNSAPIRIRQYVAVLALALAAGSAWAGIKTSRVWNLMRGEYDIVRVREVAEGVALSFRPSPGSDERDLTRQEAAELGRALLEASGEPETLTINCPGARVGIGPSLTSPSAPIDVLPRSCASIPCEGENNCLVWKCAEAKP